MSDRNPGGDRLYAGEGVDILYNRARCIHAEFCVRGLAGVFDKDKRPWIDANGASVQDIATVIERCPSGALHYERKDGVQEAVPAFNTVRVRSNGPLELRGDLAVMAADEAPLHDVRMTLCRCGASQNKPFCDNSHLRIGFEAASPQPGEDVPEPTSGGPLTIVPTLNGPLEVQGAFQIVNEAQDAIAVKDGAALCRCGHSGRKPFCDGTHRRIGFTAE
ncbi:MAG: CDGSH iron-sulfur domain-containing protein [Anaerolineae bacterium]